MIEWFEWVLVGVATLGGLCCLGMGLAGHKPNDYTLGATALVLVLLIAQVVISAIAPAAGNHPTGDGLEFWVYLITAMLIPPAAAIWALIDRTRWSTVILGVALLSVAVMAYRMGQIWFVQVA